MQKLKLALIPISIGLILVLLSWYVSYPISINSPFDFLYDHISNLYWFGSAILFASFFLVAVKSKNSTLRWAMTLGIFLLMFSQTYFYYMVSGSDANQFRGLTEYFVSTGDLNSLTPNHSYFEWPVFFILNKMVISTTGLNQRFVEFILYGVVGALITSFIYFYVSKVQTSAFVAVTAFFIMLSYFFDFQFWAPFTLSLCAILILFYLDGLPPRREVTLTMLVVFVGLTFTHILTPLFFVVYCLAMFIIKKNRKYLNLFVLTLTAYILFESYLPHFAFYLKQISVLFFGEFQYRIEATTTGPSAPQPYVDAIAQLFSRAVVITTVLVTVLGFIILLRRRKLRATDYAMLLSGAIFAVFLLISPTIYHELSNRSFFLLCIPVSIGAAYLCESKFRKYFRPVFLLLVVLFTFVLIHQAFYDQEIFFQTKAEYQYANFMIKTVNWTSPNSILSNFRLEQYLKVKSLTSQVLFGDDSSKISPGNMTSYNYTAYTIGLAKSLLAANYSVEDSLTELDANHFNLVYSSGDFYLLFER